MSAAIVESADRLVSSLVPSLPPNDPRAHRLLQLVLRLLDSRLSSSGPLTNAAVGERTRRKLLQAGRATDALKYSELIERLEDGVHGLRRLPAALQLLGSLLHSTATPQASNGATRAAALLVRPPGSAPPATTVARGLVAAPEPNVSASAATPRRAQSASASATRAAPRLASSSGETLSEAELVRDLLFVMQNIDGTHLKWEASRDAFVLPRSCAVPPGARQLVGRLSELGWLFRQVQGFVHAGSGGEVVGAGGRGGSSFGGAVAVGLVPQALRHALQAELDEWYQLIAVLEAQRQSELTLVQLLVWSAQPLQRLLLMAQLARSCARLKGGEMTVAIERRAARHTPTSLRPTPRLPLAIHSLSSRHHCRPHPAPLA